VKIYKAILCGKQNGNRPNITAFSLQLSGSLMDTLFEYQRPIGQIVQDLRSDRRTPTGPRLFGDVMRAHMRDDLKSALAAAQVVVERIESARREGTAGYIAFQNEWDTLDQAFRELLEGARRAQTGRFQSAH
jgi:hypothetical protein